MNYGYIRVSTDTQTVENQKIVITDWARNKGVVIDSWIEETKSGTVAPSKRKLGTLLHDVEKGDVIICTELSRLGRSLTMIFTILNELLEKGVGVIAIKENYELTGDIVSKVLAFAFGISAEIEREMISERTKAGLQRARMNGKRIGRRKGQKPTKYKLTGNEQQIMQKVSAGRSIYSLAHEYGVRWATMRNFINRISA